MYGFSLQFKQGKVGPDGKELIPHDSPTVNGYGYEATPSPAPGMNLQCLSSWQSLGTWRLFQNCPQCCSVILVIVPTYCSE